MGAKGTNSHGIDARRIAAVLRDDTLRPAADRLARVLSKGAVEFRLVNESDCREDGSLCSASGLNGGSWKPDAVMALGGDGTVLRALNAFPGVPALAINYGHLGFLTAGDERDLERMVFRLLSGDFLLDERMLLKATFQGRDYDVVNEVVIKGATHMVTVDIFIGGCHVHSLRGDGVIVGTPTGSTAYLLSTGSPIVMPTVECMVLCGINEFRFSSRALVIDPSETIRLRVSETTRDDEVIVTRDGRDRLAARRGDEVIIRRNEKKARLIFFEEDYFFKNLRARLNW